MLNSTVYLQIFMFSDQSINKHFSLRMKFSTKKGRMSNSNNNAEAIVCRSAIMKRESQLREAVAWCREHNRSVDPPARGGQISGS